MHDATTKNECTGIAETISIMLLGTAITLSIPVAAFFIFLKMLEQALSNVH
ncbi:hypothetical protein [Cerasicoccus maritimus]|uniref:hypothetical protein n=1 Tax=Cerasicoccus maritimus TaxID=490089 RepID=UPI002852B8DB|nr:hypothetical protein [Cerasicoccus maritimus]